MKNIIIEGCRTNNLKNISVKFPVNKLTCVTGPSGSGKSSLVFHTLASESKRRFLNSMPSSMTFFERVPQNAEVDLIEPILPVWVLPQNNPVVGSRLNLADQIELTIDIANLYYKKTYEKCPIHQIKLASAIEIFKNDIEELFTENEDVLHFLVDKEVYKSHLNGSPIRTFDIEEKIVTDYSEDDQYWELFRIKQSKINTLEKKLKEFSFLGLSETMILVYSKSTKKYEFINLKNSKKCLKCKEEGTSFARSIDEIIPFNGAGACSVCSGYGATLDYSAEKLVKFPGLSVNEGAVTILSYAKFKKHEESFKRELKKNKIPLNEPYENYEEEIWDVLWSGQGSFPGVENILGVLETMRYKRSVRIFLRGIQVEMKCTSCYGARVSEDARKHMSAYSSLPLYGELLTLSVLELKECIDKIKVNQDNESLIKRIKEKIKITVELGLGEFEISKKLKELETNEYQKSLLVRYLSYQGAGSLFVLDEPSLGLSEGEQTVLIKYLKKLSHNNTVILVDHSELIQKKSDHVIQVGPGAGHLGGEILNSGKYRSNAKKKNIKLEIPISKSKITYRKINYDNREIKKLDIKLNTINVFDSNPQSFAKNILTKVVANDLYFQCFGERKYYNTNYDYEECVGDYSFEDIIIYESSADRATGRSTIGTMLGITPHLRKYYTSLPVSKNLGLAAGHFSPNSDLGKCSVCEGKGRIEVDMQFLEDVNLKCDECDGKKLKKFYANITDGNHTVHEALNTPISKIFETIPTTPKIRRVLDYLKLLNLDYLTLDRTIPSLSGGERLRVKFLKSLEKDITNSLLVFSNLSYGLSSVELEKLRELLIGLCGKGNTVLLVDNHTSFSSFNKIDIIYNRVKS